MWGVPASLPPHLVPRYGRILLIRAHMLGAALSFACILAVPAFPRALASVRLRKDGPIMLLGCYCCDNGLLASLTPGR